MKKIFLLQYSLLYLLSFLSISPNSWHYYCGTLHKDLEIMQHTERYCTFDIYKNKGKIFTKDDWQNFLYTKNQREKIFCRKKTKNPRQYIDMQDNFYILEHIFLKIMSIFIDDEKPQENNISPDVSPLLHHQRTLDDFNQLFKKNIYLRIYFSHKYPHRVSLCRQITMDISQKIKDVLSPKEYRYILTLAINNGILCFQDIVDLICKDIFKQEEKKYRDKDYFLLIAYKTDFFFKLIIPQVYSSLLFFFVHPIFFEDIFNLKSNIIKNTSPSSEKLCVYTDIRYEQLLFLDRVFCENLFLQRRHKIFQEEYDFYNNLKFFYLLCRKKASKNQPIEFSVKPKYKNEISPKITKVFYSSVSINIMEFTLNKSALDFINGQCSYHSLLRKTYKKILYCYNNGDAIHWFLNDKLLPKIATVHSLLPECRKMPFLIKPRKEDICIFL